MRKNVAYKSVPQVTLTKRELRAWKFGFYVVAGMCSAFALLVFSGIFYLPASIYAPVLALLAWKIHQEWTKD